MQCKKCGTQLPEDSFFCFNCGAPVTKEETTKNVVEIAVEESAAEQVVEKANIEEPAVESVTENTETLGLYKTQTENTDNQNELKHETLKLEQKIEDIADKAEEKFAFVDEKVEQTIYEAEEREKYEIVHGSDANDTTGNVTIDENTANSVLMIFSTMLGLFFGGRTILKLWRFIRTLFSFLSNLRYYRGLSILFNFILTILGGVLSILPSLILAGLFLIFAFRRKKSQTSELLLSTFLGSGLAIILDLVNLIILKWSTGKDILLNGGIGLLGGALLFLVLLASGVKTLLAMNYNTAIPDSLNAVLEAITGKEGNISFKKPTANTTTSQANPASAAAPTVVASAPVVMQTTGNIQAMNNLTPPAPGTRMISTNRGLFKYIIFTILTFGIYSIFFIHSLAKDVNEMCKEDNDKVGGIFAYMILTVLTCGIYPIYWEYKIANRLQANGYRYGVIFSESGTNILLWTLLGIFICGIGPFIAMNIIIKNTNRLAQAYNANIMNSTQQTVTE